MQKKENHNISMSQLNLGDYLCRGNFKSNIFLSSCPGYKLLKIYKSSKFSNLLKSIKIFKKNKISLVIMLVQENEKHMLGLTDMPRILKKNKICFVCLPIKDMCVPKKYQKFKIRSTIKKISNQTKLKTNTLIHCQAGLGRTGLLICLFLKNIGLSYIKSINLVRSIRSGSIETKEQEDFIKNFNF
tara:strand:- start:63 stop:620 length:558 start_codon:yes stop_codon:yes gene_type:complete